MNLVFLAAFIAVCGAAKLDRTYLPPASAASAGGSSGSLQTPFARATNQGTGDLPIGSYVNDHEGVVVDTIAAGTRASSQQSGLGGSREAYGSMDSKVGEAAFRESQQNQPTFNQQSGNSGTPDLSAFQTPSRGPNSQGFDANGTPDQSGFKQPAFRPERYQLTRDRVSNIVQYRNDIDIDRFNYAFETDNGIRAEEKAIAVNGVQAEGGFSYTGDDGKVYSVTYTAGEGGYQPRGAHLPTPPPIPVEILRALEQNARDEAAGIHDDGSYDPKKYNAEGDYRQSDDDGKYNDRQSNRFGNRPGLDADTSGSFINQNKQAFAKPNLNERFGSFNTAFSNAGSFGMAMNSIFEQGQNNFNNRFATINEQQTGAQLGATGFNGSGDKNSQSFISGSDLSDNNKGGNKGTPFVQPLSQQKLQDQTTLNTFPSNFKRPTSYDASISGIVSQANTVSQFSPVSDEQVNQVSQTDYSNNDNNRGSSFGQILNMKPNLPLNTQTQTNQGFSVSSIGSSVSSNNNMQLVSKFPSSNGQSFEQLNKFTQQRPSFPNTAIDQSNQNNINKKFPSSQTSGDRSQFNFNQTYEEQNQSYNMPVSSLTTKQPFPTQQLQIFLTTPFETNKGEIPSSLNPSSFHLQPSNLPEQTATQSNYNFQPQQLNSNNFENSAISQKETTQNYRPTTSQTFSTNVQTNVQSTTSNQNFDNSYTYNRPPKPFHTPSANQETTKFSSAPLDQSNKMSQTFVTSHSTNAPQDSPLSTNYQGTYTPLSPTLASITPTQFTLSDQEINRYQTNSITQAAVSQFPATLPTTISNLEQQFSQFSSTPFQKTTQYNVNTPTSSFSQVSTTSDAATIPIFSIQSKPRDSFKQMSTQQYDGEIYQYNKPAETLSTSSENMKTEPFGAQSITQFGQQIFSDRSQSSQSISELQSGQTSTTPINNRFDSSQLPQFNQRFQPTVTEFNFDQSTLEPSTQKTSTNAQNIENTQFGEIYEYKKPEQSLSTPSESDLNQNTAHNDFNAQQTSSTVPQQSTTQFGHNNLFESQKSTTPQELSQQSVTQFNYDPTSINIGQTQTSSFNTQSTVPVQNTQFGEIYEYKKPEQSLSTPSESDLNQNTAHNGFNAQHTPSTVPQQSTAQFGQNNLFESQKSTTPQELSQQSVTQFNYDPTTINIGQPQTSSFNTQSTVPVQNTQFGFQSNSFAQQGSTFTAQKENFDRFNQQNQPQFETQTTTQFQQQNLNKNIQNNAPQFTETESQFSTTPIPTTQQIQNGQFSTQTQFNVNPSTFTTGSTNTQAYTFNMQKNNPESSQFGFQSNSFSQQGSPSGSQTQFGGQMTSQFDQNNYNRIQTTSSQFSNTRQETVAQSTTPIPTTSLNGIFSTQNQEQITDSQLGEVYEYKKPPQTLPPASQENEDNQTGQTTLQTQFGIQTTPQFGQKLNTQTTASVFSPTMPQSTIQEQFPQTDSTSSPLASSTNSVASNTELKQETSRPTYAFQSACCRGFNKDKNNDENSENISRSITTRVDSRNGFEEQKLTTKSFVGPSEQFGGPRKPPSYDESGYHY